MRTFLHPSNRRARVPLTVSQNFMQGFKRSAIAVRYPHLPRYTSGKVWDEQQEDFQTARWGLLSHTQRSMICIAGEEPTLATKHPAYNHDYKADYNHHRRVLTQKNSTRDVMQWRHTHTWNYHTSVIHPGYTFQAYPDQLWWDYVSDNENPLFPQHPTCEVNYETVFSPLPMSSDAKWIYWHTTGSTVSNGGYSKYFPDITVVSAPDPLDIENGTVAWNTQTRYSEHKASVNRACTRWILYHDCHIDEGNNIVLPHREFVLREIDPDRILDPGDPKYDRSQNDERFAPFGLTDFVCGLPSTIETGLELKSKLLAAHYEKYLGYYDGDQIDPPGPYEDVSADGIFNYDNVDDIDGNYLGRVMRYCAQPWQNDTFPTNDGSAHLPVNCKFDLLVRANFYRFKLYDWSGYDGPGFSGVLVDEGFGGAYGDCYAIY